MNKHVLNLVPHYRKRQTGAATLLLTVIVVLLVSLITYTMTRTTTLENRMTSAELRSKQAFHAAQAGLDAAFEMILNNDIAGLNTCEIVAVDGEDVPESPTFQLLFGVNEPECPSPLVGLQTKSYVRSIGRSADGSAIRVLEVAIDLVREWDSAPVPSIPGTGDGDPLPGSIISLGNISLGGNAGPQVCDLAPAECDKLYANPGASNVDISGYDSTLVIAGGSVSGGKTGSVTVEDKHISQNDPALQPYVNDPNAFFESTFGTTKETFEGIAFSASGQPSLDAVNLNPFVWHDGDLTLRGGGSGGQGGAPVYGSPDRPIVLVVDGNLTVTANVIIWGIVYVTGNVGVTDSPGQGGGMTAGNMKVFGALMAEGDIGFAKGTSEFFFNEQLSTPPPIPEDMMEFANKLDAVQASFDARSWREVAL